MTAPVNPVTVGRIATVHGVKGWVKIQSFTEPESNIIEYSPWWVHRNKQWSVLEIDQHRHIQKGILCHIKGIDDRDEARAFCQMDILVEKADFPGLNTNEYYWHQLQGLQVFTQQQGQPVNLGKVTGLMETGANDVLIVESSGQKADKRERLIPYIDQVIVSVNLEKSVIEVDWDPEF